MEAVKTAGTVTAFVAAIEAKPMSRARKMKKNNDRQEYAIIM
jgi:hypothetical protein